MPLVVEYIVTRGILSVNTATEKTRLDLRAQKDHNGGSVLVLHDVSVSSAGASESGH